MEFFNSLNLTQIKGGTKLKQGDLGSVLSYSLTDENGQEITSFDTKTAYINLVLDGKIWFTTTTLVDISRVTFRIDKAIPIGLYYLEIKIDDYIFPSDRDSIILIEEGSTPYDLKELVPNYDINMTLKGILSDLSQKGIDISDLKTKMKAIYNNALADHAEITTARGGFETLSNRLSDINNQIKNVASGSPKGTYANLSALKQDYPNGTQGVFITSDNGHWNYWNGSSWVSGGVYQGTTLSEPEKNKILDDVFANVVSGGFAAKTSNFDTAQSSADNNLYIDDNIIKGNASGITVKTTKATTAQLFVFKSQEKVTSSSKLVLVDKITFSPSQAGNFYVAFPKKYGHNILLGFSGSGLAYSNVQSHLTSFLTEEDKESLKLDEIKLFNFTSSKVQFAYSVTYEDLAIDNRVNAIKSYAEILDTSVPSYGREYPIVFDFVSGKLIFNGFLLNKYTHAQFYDFSIVNQEIPLPELDKTKKDYQNYILVAKGNELIIRNAIGGAIPQSKFDSSEREIASISIRYSSENVVKPIVYMMSSPNRHLVKVIINHTTTEDNNDQWDEVTAKIIDGGLYHYTYAALGDSITRGENSETNYSPMFGDRYTDFVSKTTGMIVNNHGIGGTRITYTDNQKGMVTRVHQLGFADIYSVFGGTNDFATNVPMGERGSDIMTQFKPAFEHICQTLRETGKKCFIITPIKRNNTMTPNSEGLTLKDYVDAEIEIAKDYGIPVLNLFDNFTQTAWKSEVLKTKYMPDGLHPNPAGMKFIGEAVTKFIKQQFEFD